MFSQINLLLFWVPFDPTINQSNNQYQTVFELLLLMLLQEDLYTWT